MTVICKAARRGKLVIKYTMAWNKTSLAGTVGEMRTEANRWNKEIQKVFRGSKTTVAVYGQQLESHPITSFAAITAKAIFPFTKINATGLKIHLWLLPVGCWEKQQPVGRKWGVSISNLPTATSFESPEWVLWKWGIFLEDSSLHLNILRLKQHPFKRWPENYMPYWGWFLNSSSHMF